MEAYAYVYVNVWLAQHLSEAQDEIWHQKPVN